MFIYASQLTIIITYLSCISVRSIISIASQYEVTDPDLDAIPCLHSCESSTVSLQMYKNQLAAAKDEDIIAMVVTVRSGLTLLSESQLISRDSQIAGSSVIKSAGVATVRTWVRTQVPVGPRYEYELLTLILVLTSPPSLRLRRSVKQDGQVPEQNF